jgi:hypothetical protein
MTRWIEASVSILRCGGCSQTTPHLTFAGDTDMVTFGIASLSSMTTNEIVVVEAEPAEWSDETGERLQVRVNEQLGRLDLRFVRLLRADETAANDGVSFQEFRNTYRPRRLIYACPNCGAGEATPVGEQTPSDYQGDGGKLTVLAELEVRD